MQAVTSAILSACGKSRSTVGERQQAAVRAVHTAIGAAVVAVDVAVVVAVAVAFVSVNCSLCWISSRQSQWSQ